MDGINLKNVPQHADNPRTAFDLSFKRAFDFKFGELVPVLMLPVVPKDEIALSYEHLLRFAPFVSQVMQDYKICFDFYYVPNSLLYSNFENFMSAGYDGKTQYVHPYVDPGIIASRLTSLDMQHSLFDYLDINPGFWSAQQSTLSEQRLNALPLFAYVQCYLDHHIGVDTKLNKLLQQLHTREYFCDDGDNTSRFIEYLGRINQRDPDFRVPENFSPSLFSLFERLYPLDYFTSARSNPQLGNPMTIPVQLLNTDVNGTMTFQLLNEAGSSGIASPLGFEYTQGSKEISVGQILPNSQTVSPNRIVINGGVFNNAATITDFYAAARLQELLTLYGYSGFTPSERLAAEYGVKNPDSRMHKAEWLHSSIHDVQIGEVFSNNVNAELPSSSNLDIPGSGTAIGTANNFDNGFKSYFMEHGWLVGFLSVYPEASYSQGLPRHFSIRDRFDYPHYLLSEIGMASIKYKEVLAVQANQRDWDNDWAYMSQYGDFKVGLNRINGSLRDSLQYMSAGRLFGGSAMPNYKPLFNDAFLQVDPSRNNLNRTFNAVSSYRHDCPLVSKLSFNIRANRQLPYYGLPRF